jgi:multiple sugar transport system permease protein
LSHNGKRKGRRDSLLGWSFAAPYVLLLFAFGLGPIGYAVYESLTDGPQGRTGFANYRAAFQDFRFVPAVEHVALFLLIYLPVMVVGVIVLALVMHQRPGRSGSVLRVVYILPGAVVGSASILLWYVMLEPTLSPFKPLLNGLGFQTGADVFQNSNLVWVFAFMAFMTGFGQWVVIMYGALQGVPEELVEAATLDGCNAWQLATRVKLPLITKYIVYMLILAFAAGVQIFAEPQLLYSITLSASSPWWSLNQLGLVYAFQNADFASAAAVSLVLFVVCGLAALIVVRFTDFFRTEVG